MMMMTVLVTSYDRISATDNLSDSWKHFLFGINSLNHVGPAYGAS